MCELGPDLRNNYLKLSLRGGGQLGNEKNIELGNEKNIELGRDPPKQTNQMPAQAHRILGFYGTSSVANKQLHVSHFEAERSGQ